MSRRFEELDFEQALGYGEPMPKLPRAILLDVIPPTSPKEEGFERLAEAESLVSTYGGIVVVKTVQRRGIPDYKTFVGSGKIEELRTMARELQTDYLIINNPMKYRQIYELGEILRKDKIQVWDRLDLILKIFAKHARTMEAKLEIELASIRHMGPRIYGMGMELSRQGGGIGTSGIGETNTEIMKRHLKERTRKILDEIGKYERVRAGHRKARTRAGLKTVSIVGYTNAGKTQLLNTLTRRQEYSANELFATLDTRVGKMHLPNSHLPVLVTDTIGFIRDLPPELISAFTSTLSEAVEADLLLHVIDVADPKMEMKIEVVEKILERLGLAGTPKIYVFNKTDLALKRFGMQTLVDKYADFHPQFVSAITRTGLEELKVDIEKMLLQNKYSGISTPHA